MGARLNRGRPRARNTLCRDRWRQDLRRSKNATLFAMKVLNDKGRGHVDSVIAAIDEVAADAPKRHCPRGVAMSVSLGFAGSQQSLQQATANLVKKGFFFAASAGNKNKDAEGHSPAGEPLACTVGAMDEDDKMASFSNFGPLVDPQAPGVDVVSAKSGGGSVS
ncbi:hypothetical protein VHEMI00774 [[Torrubiella] hemipterigena]|nr:hypothetical protein VHEMI00774 [[Torrubiella] hemipterigena]